MTSGRPSTIAPAAPGSARSATVLSTTNPGSAGGSATTRSTSVSCEMPSDPKQPSRTSRSTSLPPSIPAAPMTRIRIRLGRIVGLDAPRTQNASCRNGQRLVDEVSQGLPATATAAQSRFAEAVGKTRGVVESSKGRLRPARQRTRSRVAERRRCGKRRRPLWKSTAKPLRIAFSRQPPRVALAAAVLSRLSDMPRCDSAAMRGLAAADHICV
jgi:hypothetical protein